MHVVLRCVGIPILLIIGILSVYAHMLCGTRNAPHTFSAFPSTYGTLTSPEVVLIYKPDSTLQYIFPGGVCSHSCRTNHLTNR